MRAITRAVPDIVVHRCIDQRNSMHHTMQPRVHRGASDAPPVGGCTVFDAPQCTHVGCISRRVPIEYDATDPSLCYGIAAVRSPVATVLDSPSASANVWIGLLGAPHLVITVAGKPCGFVASGHNHRSKRTDKAWRYCSDVRKAAARAAGQHGEMRLRETSKTNPMFIGTVAYFENGTHPDPENVHKLCKDALYHKVRGGDKYTGGVYAPPQYDRENPRVEILVWELTN